MSKIPQKGKWRSIDGNTISLTLSLNFCTESEDWCSVYWSDERKLTAWNTQLLECWCFYTVLTHSTVTSAPTMHFGAYFFLCMEFPSPRSSDCNQQWKCSNRNNTLLQMDLRAQCGRQSHKWVAIKPWEGKFPGCRDIAFSQVYPQSLYQCLTHSRYSINICSMNKWVKSNSKYLYD